MKNEAEKKNFFDKMTVLLQRQESRPCFIFGNGVNLHFLDPHHKGERQYTWNILLETIAVRLKIARYSEFNQSNQEIFNTELADYIKMANGETEKSFKQAVADALNEKYHVAWNGIASCPMLDYAFDHGHILTTNFDKNIEDYFKNKGIKDFFKHSITMETAKQRKKVASDKPKRQDKKTEESFSTAPRLNYRWNCFWDIYKKSKNRNLDLFAFEHDIWHIHGSIYEKALSSILFTSAEYAQVIGRFKRMGDCGNTQWKGNKTWLKFFFQSPLVFVGLGLSPQEIFLRHLLLERFRCGNDFSTVFYLFTKEEKQLHEVGGNKFISMLGGTNVEFDSYDDLYNNDNWNK